jgi:hypothetical protein
VKVIDGSCSAEVGIFVLSEIQGGDAGHSPASPLASCHEYAPAGSDSLLVSLAGVVSPDSYGRGP